MAVAMRTNGLHHAVSLGTIEVASKPPCSSHYDRTYDSEDENMSRRRLRHTSSTELYPRASVYSKGDIREQYCLTDRQLSSIERPRRDRFFGCLSRRSAPQSFLGVCVGRRVPSDENLAAYAPFYKYPRYQHQYHHDDKSPDSDMDSSYFRRQPASILSTAKMSATDNTGNIAGGGGSDRYSWVGGAGGLQQPSILNENNANAYTNEQSSFHCPTHIGLPAVIAQQSQQSGPATPRTKHVSFARSHTLTSFDDVNLGFRSSGRLKAARSQERLIGGKKPIIATGSIYEPPSTQMPMPMSTNLTSIQKPFTPIGIHPQQAVLHQHQHIHGHGHSHLPHHHGPPIHIHQFVPATAYSTVELGGGVQQVQTEQPLSLITNRNFIEDMGMGVMPPQQLAAQSPEVVIVEKKFRNAMKTQATQTEGMRKEILALSPRTLHKVKVVSQGAQTNGLQNGKKLTKSLSEMPNGKLLINTEIKEPRDMFDHEFVHRTQSEDAPRSPLELMQSSFDINYYEPPPPLQLNQVTSRRISHVMSPKENIAPYYHNNAAAALYQSIATETCPAFNLYAKDAADFEDSYIANNFDYESNSLPRRACSFHRGSEFSSNSLPRRDPMHSHEICKHITECSELMGSGAVDSSLDFTRPHLLPPPSQYCKDDEEEPVTVAQSHQHPHHIPPKEFADTPSNRRMSMVVTLPEDNDTPFRRDDLRRQSMPVYVKTEKLIDGYGPRISFRSTGKSTAMSAAADDKEIFIDFKPHISPRRSSPQAHKKYRDIYTAASETQTVTEQQLQQRCEEQECENCRALAAAAENTIISDSEDHDLGGEDPLYENVPNNLPKLADIVPGTTTDSEKKITLRKRSVSLDEPADALEEKSVVGISGPPSPCRDEMLAIASTYPSSDSLANDVTRDHSDGIWNESQVTVLTVEHKDISESSYNSHLLLTPSSKRKNLILQHQQRSSIDTDALDFEDQYVDHSPTYSNITVTKATKIPTNSLSPQQQLQQQQLVRELKTTLAPPPLPMTKVIPPSIAVTPSFGYTVQEMDFSSPKISPCLSKRSPVKIDTAAAAVLQSMQQQKRGEATKFNVNVANTDVSECSTNTNTDEYATCTDTSKRTPGIKTPPTTTSSSSTTQVPVSTQSSQVDKTHGGSSFESASSLYSTRGEILSDDILQYDDQSLIPIKFENDNKLKSPARSMDMTKKSPSHSISSTSSGSYNVAALPIASSLRDSEKGSASMGQTAKTVVATSMVTSTLPPQSSAATKIKLESVSDDERSEVRYSSSGYYESPPHDEDNVAKSRRHRLDEDRKRRKTSMKLDIEKENLRALTSPIKKPQQPQLAATMISKERSPEKQATVNAMGMTSPNKIKRFRPKIRRQFRRNSRDDNTPKRQKNVVNLYGMPAAGSNEKLLDSSMIAKPPEERRDEVSTSVVVEQTKPTAKVITSPIATKSASEVCSLKAKSVESLRSVSPGSDSVFYSEADGMTGDQHSHCLHCCKVAEGQGSSVISALGGDSVESLPHIEDDNGQDIVKPPSDFADSPVTTKTTQRLYKKMDKRFRSEERYHIERGRHYKTRQENIRAKSEERSRESNIRSPHTLRPAGSSPCVLPDTSTEQIVYRGHYDASRYTRLTDSDVWMQLDHKSLDAPRERTSSTDSERSFHSKYQVILHRLVQRLCTLEMYHRQKSSTFQLISSSSSPESVRRKLEEILKLMLLVWAREGYVLSKITDGAHGIDKTVVVKSDSGEFGFRIHGSKPVVVAAIEPETPAESSGLEVGDIIISVNGVQVLDKNHTEVVKIAHDGCETLELKVASTIGVLMNEQHEPPSQPLYSGYLWRQSGQAKGSPNTKKWVRRWFCLRPDNCLYYYKTEDDTQPIGAMIMAKHIIEHCPPDVGKPYAFKIDSGEGIPMYVAADTEELSNRWIKVLKQSAAQETPWLDNCARNIYQSPNSITRPDCFGYLIKLGSRWVGWSKCYCVLKDACLYFYQDANSKTAFGMACLHGYKVASTSSSSSGKKNSFEIIPPEPKLRHYYCCTESDMDKKRWISALEYSIDRWIKSG